MFRLRSKYSYIVISSVSKENYRCSQQGPSYTLLLFQKERLEVIRVKLEKSNYRDQEQRRDFCYREHCIKAFGLLDTTNEN